MFLDFSGSDWSEVCETGRRGVQAGRVKPTQRRTIVRLVDFPKAKPQSDEVKKQNEELRVKYKIEGFPTIIILSPEGELEARPATSAAAPRSTWNTSNKS